MSTDDGAKSTVVTISNWEVDFYVMNSDQNELLYNILKNNQLHGGNINSTFKLHQIIPLLIIFL